MNLPVTCGAMWACSKPTATGNIRTSLCSGLLGLFERRPAGPAPSRMAKGVRNVSVKASLTPPQSLDDAARLLGVVGNGGDPMAVASITIAPTTMPGAHACTPH